jgi:hypothetical protein
MPSSTASALDTAAANTGPTRPTLRVRYRLTPWWVKIIVVFVASRIVSTIILVVFAWYQAANPWTGAHPDYFSFAQIWDGTWYHIISLSGYPSKLPFDNVGRVEQNAWAFLPAYPYLCGALAWITGLPFSVVGVFVSAGFGLGTALVFYRLMLPLLGAPTAMFSAVLFCFAPLSPIMQVDYAESMQLFFLACALLYLVRRQYWLMLTFVAVMSFTRPSGLAFALAMGLHVVYRFVVRARDPFPVREMVSSVAATGISLLLGLAWPAIAGAVTGVPDAYTATELTWRVPYVGVGPLVPFQPWTQGATWWSEYLGISNQAIGFVVLLAAMALFAFMMVTRPVKKLGPDLRIWVASWTIYILAVFFPQSSVFRIFMPIFPMLGVVAMPKSIVYRIGMILVFIAGQVAWVYFAFWINGNDWTPP